MRGVFRRRTGSTVFLRIRPWLSSSLASVPLPQRSLLPPSSPPCLAWPRSRKRCRSGSRPPWAARDFPAPCGSLPRCGIRRPGPLGQVRFFVDQALLASVSDGPPYATEWIDENPFERREITVEVDDGLGHEARDKVVLQPFEVTEAAEVASVLLEASVQDQQQRFVKGLQPSAFSLLENGVPQTLDIVRQEDVGATFALLVDSSASMSRRMDFAQRTAATLAGYLRPQDRIVVAPFARTVGAVTGPTNDRPTILEGIRAIRPSGGTAILDSLAQMCRSLADAEGRRAIVLITDGYDEQSSTTFEEALASVKKAGVTVYVVGVGGVAGISIKGERLLRRLAVESGGRFFFPSRDEQLPEVHDVLTGDVQNRYLITYTPTDQTPDGTWRAITVKTGNPQYAVRTRAGYDASKPAPIRPAVEFTVTGPWRRVPECQRRRSRGDGRRRTTGRRHVPGGR